MRKKTEYAQNPLHRYETIVEEEYKVLYYVNLVKWMFYTEEMLGREAIYM